MHDKTKPPTLETVTTGSASRPDGGKPDAINPDGWPEIEIDGFRVIARPYRTFVDFLIIDLTGRAPERQGTIWAGPNNSLEGLSLIIATTNAYEIAHALTAITSANKEEREQAKKLIRAWKKRGQAIMDFAAALMAKAV